MKNFLIIGLALNLLMACGQAEQSITGEVKAQNYSWSLVTTWPKNYPGLGMAPERFSKLVEEMTQGQLKVTVYGAGEFVPAMGVFDAVSSGAVEIIINSIDIRLKAKDYYNQTNLNYTPTLSSWTILSGAIWLPSGTTLSKGTNCEYISVIEFSTQ